jgi:nitric oxide reductase NorE protein
VFIDMVIFLLIFLVFMADRANRVEMYTASQANLNPWVGFGNALILLTSSWLVAAGVRAGRDRRPKQLRQFLGLAWLLGATFAINKIIEYSMKFSVGISPATSPFYSFYFFITFVHFLHVLAGLLFIAYCHRQAGSRGVSAQSIVGLENVGLFWHFVDILWLYIFPLLYLIGRVA